MRSYLDQTIAYLSHDKDAPSKAATKSRIKEIFVAKADVDLGLMTTTRKGTRSVRIINVKGFTKGVGVKVGKVAKAYVITTDSCVLTTPRTIPRLAEKLGLTERDILGLSHIPERTFQRWEADDKPLPADASDRVLRIARVSSEAVRVFGDDERATRWLKTPSPLLGDAPLNLLSTDAGSREVEDELTRIEWGDFA